MAQLPRAPLEQRDRVARPDEGEILARHCAGDASAFGELIERYRAPVYGYLVRRGVDTDARDDLFQEIFLRIHRAAASYRSDAALHPWIFTIVANTVRSHYRKLRVRRLVFTEAESEPEETPGQEPDGHQVSQARETAARIEAGLRRLPDSQREVVLLCCVEKLSQAEVSEILGIPAATLRTRLARGRAGLARLIAPHSDAPETSE